MENQHDRTLTIEEIRNNVPQDGEKLYVDNGGVIYSQDDLLPKHKKGEDSSLSDQFNMVLKKELEAGKKFEQDILKLRASKEDILTWWKTRDPLVETIQHTISSTDKSKLPYIFEKDGTLSLYGSACLLINTLYPNLEEKDLVKWTNKILRENNLEESDDVDEIFLMILKMVNKHLGFNKRNTASFTKDELNQLLICVEMVGRGTYLQYTIHDPDYFFEVGMMRVNILDIISSGISIEEQQDGNDKKEVDEMRMMALKASILQNSYAENSIVITKDNTTRRLEIEKTRKMLSHLLNDFQFLFNNPENKHNTMWQRLKSPAIKGALHEALWYLDFTMLKHMYPGKYRNVMLIPSMSNADRPEIGNPENNRAYDFFVRQGNTQETFRDFIQLKSSPQSKNKPGNKKKYHPLIKVIEEQNFMDLNPSRLRAKINTYQKIFSGGFKKEDADKLDNYILPTVKEYFKTLHP